MRRLRSIRWVLRLATAVGLAAAATVAGGATPALAAPTVTALDLGTLGSGRYAEIAAINEWRTIAGSVNVSPFTSQRHAFRRTTDGVLTDLGTLPGGQQSIARDINLNGDVVGSSETGTAGSTHATLWRDGQVIDLGTLGGAASSAWAISDRRVVVGEAQTAAGSWHAFRWASGVMTDLGPGVAYGVNERGDVVGDDGSYGVRWSGGTQTRLPVPAGGGGSSAGDVNERGQVVLQYSDAVTIDPHAAVVTGGDAVDLGLPADDPWFGGLKINDRGDVVGYGQAQEASVWYRGQFVRIPALAAGGSTDVNDLDNKGHVVGRATVNGETHAVLWTIS